MPRLTGRQHSVPGPPGEACTRQPGSSSCLFLPRAFSVLCASSFHFLRLSIPGEKHGPTSMAHQSAKLLLEMNGMEHSGIGTVLLVGNPGAVRCFPEESDLGRSHPGGAALTGSTHLPLLQAPHPLSPTSAPPSKTAPAEAGRAGPPSSRSGISALRHSVPPPADAQHRGLQGCARSVRALDLKGPH